MKSSSQILQELVQVKSYSGTESDLANYIIAFAQQHQIEWERQAENVIFKFIKNKSKCLIFDGHMDTVDSGAISAWEYPPFGPNSGVTKDNKVYGLGASDMKAGLASFLQLSLELKAIELPVDVIFAFVTKEEVDGSGSAEFVKYFQSNYQSQYEYVAAILGEPTNLQLAEIGHKGNFFLTLTTIGDSGHGSRPWLIQNNSILLMQELITKVMSVADKLSNKYAHELIGKPSFCLTSISSDSTAPNKVSGQCSTVWDIRTTPELHVQLISELQATVGTVAKLEIIGESPFGFTDKSSPMIINLNKLVTGLKLEVSAGASDICFFTQAGIDAVAFGPGHRELIHQPNEYCKIDQLDEAIGIYLRLIKSL